MSNWISAINNAVKSTIEGGASVRNFDRSKMMMESHEESAQLKNIQTALTGKGPHHHHTVHGTNPMNHNSNHSHSSSVSRRTTVGARPAAVRRNSSTFGDNPEKLLQMIREADPSNSCCADCGSLVKAEWVSINLGIVLCIGMSNLSSPQTSLTLHRMQRPPSIARHPHFQSPFPHPRCDLLHTRPR